MTKVFPIFLLFFIFCLPVQGQNSDVPGKGAVDLMIAADNSGSFRLVLDRQFALIREIAGGAAPGDRGGLMTYASASVIRQRQELTEDVGELIVEAENIYAEPGAKAMLDGVRHAAYLLGKSESGNRRVLILITDGADRESASSVADVVSVICQHSVELHVIVVADGVPSTKLIDRLVRDSGGRRYVPKKRSDDPETVRELWNNIRAGEKNQE
ncbi:MAG: VWA domain-containing protein [Blastocatellia bacterium]|nr:VWA domain-containing protein [Blastocatellia bacterium]